MKKNKFIVIAGPNVLESVNESVKIAKHLKDICDDLGFRYVFKGGFGQGCEFPGQEGAGPGIRVGLLMLELIKLEAKVEIAAEVYEPWQVAPVASVADVLQIPVAPRREAKLALAASSTGKPVILRKGPFLSSQDMADWATLLKKGGASPVWLCERGDASGTDNLANDMPNLGIIGKSGCPVIFDATRPDNQQGRPERGQATFVERFSHAADEAWIHGLYVDTHPEPEKAVCKGTATVPLSEMVALLGSLEKCYRKIYEIYDHQL